jgi:hypothetical protein
MGLTSTHLRFLARQRLDALLDQGTPDEEHALHAGGVKRNVTSAVSGPPALTSVLFC